MAVVFVLVFNNPYRSGIARENQPHRRRQFWASCQCASLKDISRVKSEERMGDVADILGVTASPKSAEPVVDDSKPTAWSTSPEMLDLDDSNIMQSAVSGRNVDLNGSKGGMKVLNPAPSVEDSAPPPAITKTRKSAVKVGSKWIDTQKPARKWVWAPFTSSSRNDGLVLNHWVRAGVEYLDYPYARFDIHLDPVQYTDDEYKSFLINESWTKSETDFLMDLARKLELRWPVIHDRWLEAFDDHVNDDTWQARKVEDLQHRYYTVAAILLQSRISREATLEAKAIETASIALQNNTTDAPTPDPRGAGENRKEEELLLETAAARALASSDPQHQPLIRSLGTGATNKLFDIAYETERRAQLEALWRRSKAEEEEELELRKELKQVESEIRKLKKSGGHIAPTISEPASRTASPSVANPVDRPVTLAPIPTPGFPYLQSGRLVAPTSGVSKLLLKNMDTLLKEMNIPERPLPTKVVCDLYDSVRSDAIALLVLRKTALQKEGLLQAKRLKLAKLGAMFELWTRRRSWVYCLPRRHASL